ncbi:hypothetical protein [Vulgatibacter sp.]|uniref:hypothetical protein n=1 Tax=Vulgatibacter sp. TaxID=1971226 RepID=UPI0035630DED
MELATGLALLFVGVALARSAAPARLPVQAVRLAGLVLVAVSARWFFGPGGAFVGIVQYLLGLSLVASAYALAVPLHPLVAPVATGCMALVAVALELAR